MSLDREYLYKVDRSGRDEVIDEKANRKPTPRKTPIEVGWTWRLAIASFTTSFGAGLPAGFSLGVVNTPSAIIKQWCNETAIDRYDLHLTDSGITVLWSAAVSTLLIGGMIGALSGAIVANKIGRRGAMILGEFGFIVAAALFFVSKPFKSLECLFAGRMLAGLCSGLITAVMPMYLTEMAPMTLQGTVGAMCPLALTFGVFFAQVMGLDSLLGTVDLWNILLSLYALFTLPCCLFIPWLCESPKYLDGVRKNRMGAIRELCKLRNLPPEIVVHELDDVKNDGEKEKWSVLRLLGNRDLRLNLALVCALQFGQQLSGINAVFFYSTDIFMSAGLSKTNAQLGSLGASSMNFIVSAIMMPITNHNPRRFLAILSTSLSVVMLISLTVFIEMMDQVSFFSYMSIVGVIGYIVAYCLGLGPIPYFIGSELFDVGPRPSAMALGSVCNWTGNFSVGLGFLVVHDLIGAYSFLIFAGSTLLLTLFLYFCLPETNAKVLAERSESQPQL